MRAVEEAPRGVLHLRSGRRRFEVARSQPGEAPAELVEHYWTVSWDLRGRDPTSSTPCPTRASTWSPSRTARGSWG